MNFKPEDYSSGFNSRSSFSLTALFMNPFLFDIEESLSIRSKSNLTEMAFCLNPEGLPAPFLFPPDFPLTPTILISVFGYKLSRCLQCVR